MSMKKGLLTGAVAGVTVAAVALAGAGVRWPTAMAEEQRAPVNQTVPGAASFAPPPGAPLSFADIFERVAPAVVSIDVTSKTKASDVQAELAKRFGIPVPKKAPKAKPGVPAPKGAPGAPGAPGADQGDDQAEGADEDAPAAMASGSGFFISSDGYIVTNNHVIADSDTITVRLNDKRELKGRIIGRDEGTDLAVIKVEGKDFPYVDFENRAKPRVGDWVIAVGNPFLLGGTATAGIVSASSRDIGEAFVDYLQIDAPINRGNSGGPTFDIYGRVIGVNTAIFSPTGGSVGIGFAIPADVAEKITKQLMTGKAVVRGYLGVGVYDVTKDVGESLGIAAKHGVLVGEVTAGGPAEKAGVQNGDIIVSVNGKPLASRSELTRAVAMTSPGDPLKIEVLRNGKTQVLTAKAGTRPSETALANRLNGEEDKGAADAPDTGKPQALGLAVSPLTDALRRKFDIRPGVHGVVVTGLEDGTDAAKKGLRPGDVVVSANQKPLESPADLVAAVAEAKKAGRTSIFTMVSRGPQTGPLVLKLDK
jgi:serine protease Do